MDKSQEQDIRKKIESYQAIKAKIDVASYCSLAKKLKKIIEDKEALKELKEDPKKIVTKEFGIPEEKTDFFIKSIEFIVAKIEDIHDPGVVFDVEVSESKDQMEYWNWDRSSSSTKNYQNDTDTEAGFKELSDKGSYRGVDENFKKNGISAFDPTIFMMENFSEYFFPAQPLVTNQLIDEIITILKK